MAEVDRKIVWRWDEVKGTSDEGFAIHDAISDLLREQMKALMSKTAGWHPFDHLTFVLDREAGEVVLSKPDPEPLTPEQERERWLEVHGGHDAAVEFYMATSDFTAGWYVECGHCESVPSQVPMSHEKAVAKMRARAHVEHLHGIAEPVIHLGEPITYGGKR